MALVQVPLLHSSPITSPRLQVFNQQRGLSIRERDGIIVSRRPSRLHVVCSVRENVAPPQEAQSVPSFSTLGKSNFKRLVPDFHFGSASASYQVEGAWNIDGRKPSIWDDFCHNFIDKITDMSTGDIATDAYHRYEEDIKLMKDLGLDSYRFSLSWSRILPDGTLAGGKNQKGIEYYNKLINKILEYGLTPFVTIFHWDVPSALEEEYGGFRDRKIVQDFKDYANVCFDEFGDRVKNWITVNEAWTLSSMGYGLGWHAPGRCSAMFKDTKCPVPEGDSLVEPYIVSHHLILAHAEAVKLYREKYNVGQKGQIGISLTAKWFKPYSNQRKDVQAAERGVDFMIGWYLDPIVYGDYPFTMRVMLRDRLPTFTEEERKLITGSYDFIGINYYTSAFAEGLRFEDDKNTPYFSIRDNYVYDQYKRDGKYIGEPTESWIYIAPDGIKDILLYVKKIYNDPKIYITENGMCEINNADQTLAQAIDDKQRETYLKLHLAQILQAIQDGVNVKGYFHWSFTDNFEWQEGYTQRFGMYYIDYADNLKRVPKTNSIPWFKKFLVS